MTTSTDMAGEWAVERIPANDAGRAFYLAQYKPFRLAALKQDPQAFGSTYAREVAFSDETWVQRLDNPRVKTFVAVRLHDRRILSAVSLIGPMPSAEQTVTNPTRIVLSAQATPSDRGKEKREEGHQEVEKEDELGADNEVSLLYQNTGVYTRPEARGKGLGLKLMATAVECARQEARRLLAGDGRNNKEQSCQLGVEVYRTNEAAIGFYRKCGFEVRGAKVPESEDDENRPEVCMYYKNFLG
ncbi:Acyl-CoA N-acyltransferase [Apiospora arundinis]|uniref:Acyl-CoA N-acyltransferase n=1 Tax=Apiospora arundinis TaxID=335852 RepID=A0ABR2J5Z8_9PEZI